MKNKQRLMIHRFIDDYLNYPLNDYILTFDDGLYNHYTTYKKIIDKFPNIKMEYYISTNIICDENIKQIDNIESPDAHDIYFNTNNKSAFINYSQIKEMSKINNITIGLHGHNHLNIEKLYKKKRLFDRIEIFKDDCIEMLKVTNQFIADEVIDHDRSLHYCTPYNQYYDLEIALLKKIYRENNMNLYIIGKERIDIETL